MALITKANEEFWSTATSGYDAADWQRELVTKHLANIRTHSSWLGFQSPPAGDVKILDYACGPGVVSLALLPYVTNILGIDANEQQVAEYNRRAAGSNLSPSEVHAETGDLLVESPDPKFEGPEYKNFDYALSSLAFHHVDDPNSGIKALSSRLKPGTGKLVIIEFHEDKGSSQDPQPHSHDHNDHHHHHHHHHGEPQRIVRKNENREERHQRNEEYKQRSHDNSHLKDETKPHGPHGFGIEEMEGMFKDAGLVDVKSMVMAEKFVIGKMGIWEVFMTVGTKT